MGVDTHPTHDNIGATHCNMFRLEVIARTDAVPSQGPVRARRG